MTIKARITSLVIGVATAAAAVFGAPAAAADTSPIGGGYPIPALITTAASGTVGARVLLGDQWCRALGPGGQIDAPTTLVGRTRAYPNSTQVITQQAVLLQYVNGSWRVSVRHPATSLTARVGQDVWFLSVKTFTTPLNSWFSVVEVTSWYVNGVLVGRAEDIVNGDAVVDMDGRTVTTSGSAVGQCLFVA